MADTISRLRILGLYQDNGNDDLSRMDDNVVDNIVEEVHAIKWVAKSASYKMGSSIWMY